MYRTGIEFLNEWLTSPSRKPLVIRGARQVGKTWIVRQLAKIHNRELVEINFEKTPQLLAHFESNDPKRILLLLSNTYPSIDPQKSLLFLDEIQVAPELIAKLRWFYEDMPELPVIAAGSLLEFVLGIAPISMPVGRISYMHLEPLSFEEFLLACNKSGLVKYLKNYQWHTNIPAVIHQDLLTLCKEYIIVGGMPKAVSTWAQSRSLQDVGKVHYDLMANYRDDFTKYSTKLDKKYFEDVIRAVPLLLGQKFVYSKVNPDIRTAFIKEALDLLSKARVCHKVFSTAANGLPLGAETQEKFIKVIFIDVGLCSTALDLRLEQLGSMSELDLINKGGIPEQLVGQLLRTIAPFYVEPKLYYWQRPQKGSSAEVDYVIQNRGSVLPIEVKAGSTGTLKSLHLFMDLKKLKRAVRINSDIPHVTDVDVKDSAQERIKYQLLSIPFYLIGELPRLLSDAETLKTK